MKLDMVEPEEFDDALKRLDRVIQTYEGTQHALALALSLLIRAERYGVIGPGS
jgi:hypothetical protein